MNIPPMLMSRTTPSKGSRFFGSHLTARFTVTRGWLRFSCTAIYCSRRSNFRHALPPVNPPVRLAASGSPLDLGRVLVRREVRPKGGARNDEGVARSWSMIAQHATWFVASLLVHHDAQG
jgi:hypothetical protein